MRAINTRRARMLSVIKRFLLFGVLWTLTAGVYADHHKNHHQNDSGSKNNNTGAGTHTVSDDVSNSGTGASVESVERDERSESAALPLVNILNNIKSLHGRYRQETISADQQTLQSITGELWVDANGRFRIVSDDPFEPVLVSDGHSFWNYDVGLDQVTISTLNDDVQQVPVLLLSGHADQIAEAFVVERFEIDNTSGSGAREQYLLTPRRADSIFETMVVGIEDRVPRMISVSDSLGQHTTIELSDIRINRQLPDTLFQLELPPGIDVIDER